MTLSISEMSLSRIAQCPTFRCDPRYYAKVAIAAEAKVRSASFFELGEFLPTPAIKGIQPSYLDAPTDDSVPVVNTLSVQGLKVNEDDCRHISRDDYDDIEGVRKLRKDDVLLTMDGGVSIGKAALFVSGGDFTVDSHVCILRPVGIAPRSLVYLLASPMGQQQFRRAESGASGQTAVTEEDIRRFVFPSSLLVELDAVVDGIENERAKIEKERAKLAKREAAAWQKLEALTI